MNSKNRTLATIFFLSVKDRPKSYPPLENFKGEFWHTGIIVNDEGKVYECFNHAKNCVSGLEKLEDKQYKKAVLVHNVSIDMNVLISEISSGTDCAEYVARCTGLSILRGASKGNFYPEDIYNELVAH
jgi:hypothetical protein